MSLTTYVLPGMGADHTLFSAPAWRNLTSARFLDWPHYSGETTIESLANKVIEIAGITDGDIVVGTSLGGIVACEIAKQRNLRAIVLVAGAIHPNEISKLLNFFHPLAQFAPIQALQGLASKLPSHNARMFSQSQPEFIRATCKAVFTWPGMDGKRITPIRIHGTRDHVISHPSQVDLSIERGGHLIAMTHAKECVEYLNTRFLQLI